MLRSTKRRYNVPFQLIANAHPGRASRARTIVVQTARNCGLTRDDALSASDFHNVFHRNCEDRETAGR
jgi:hypothetical protein